ncbi:MAG TPA: outer membrane beta-barrel protein [Terriglobales bacterium]|nr:outer membrane beta-barrel protein [Terriglobales bacterium]
MRILAAVVAINLCALPLRAQGTAGESNAASADEMRELRQLVQELKAKVDRLEQNAPRQPATQNTPGELNADPVVPHEALVAETGAASSQATLPEKPKKAEPFAFADWTWLTGNPRTKTPAFDSPFFTPEIRADVDYVFDFRRPKDDTIGGSSEIFRTHEIQVTQLGVGGDFHFDNVRARVMTQFGMYSFTTPRNDASPSRGQWNLDGAYRYLSEAYGGYHFNAMHGINVDAGIFMSYIGLFSYYNFDNWSYQPSYVSSNTPWFFNGVRVQMFPTEKLKIEPWFINGWQSYGRFNGRSGVGGQILWRPTNWMSIVSNNYGVGADALGIPTRTRIHTDNSIQIKYLDRPGAFLDKAAFSLTGDAGCESGGGVACLGNAVKIINGERVVYPKQSFLGFMAYNRFWFHNDRYGLTIGGGKINNPGRYLVLLPPINGATAASGTPYFTENPGDKFKAWDASLTWDYMPSQYITFRTEYNYRAANVPYFSGRGGITPPGGNQGPPGSVVDGFTPDLVKDEARVIGAILVKF